MDVGWKVLKEEGGHRPVGIGFLCASRQGSASRDRAMKAVVGGRGDGPDRLARRKRWRMVQVGLASTVPVAMAMAMRDPDGWQRRAVRTVGTAWAAAKDYHRTCLEVEKMEGKGRSGMWCPPLVDMHRRQAARLLELARRNGGMYAKIAQFVAARSNVGFPEVYGKTLQQMQDRADPKPFATVRKVLEQEMGRHAIQRDFSRIEEAPIAAASIAQVHRAQLMDGRKVAVKVQYPQIKKQFMADLFLLETLNALSQFLLPKLNLKWLLKDFRESCHQELDFRREQRNAKALTAIMKGVKGLHVPEVLDGLSSARVIVMEYVEGWRIDDKVSMKSHGISERDVASLLANAYGRMMFVGGMVHCDPHAGNLLVRKSEKGGPELVFLDHGLYVEISTKLRKDYASLWVALKNKSNKNLQQATKKLGVPTDLLRFHPLLFEGDPPAQHRAWQTIPRQQRKDMDTWVSSRMDGQGQLAHDAMRFLTSLPKEIIHLHRAQAIVASLDRELVGRGKGEDARLDVYFKYAKAAAS
eukprot:scaffold944_cov333-Pavlova_lutheri.AAC.24